MVFTETTSQRISLKNELGTFLTLKIISISTFNRMFSNFISRCYILSKMCDVSAFSFDLLSSKKEFFASLSHDFSCLGIDLANLKRFSVLEPIKTRDFYQKTSQVFS